MMAKLLSTTGLAICSKSGQIQKEITIDLFDCGQANEASVPKVSPKIVQLEAMITSQMSVDEQKRLRQRFDTEHLTIGELAEEENLPIVLVWCVVTPSDDSYVAKFQLLKKEIKIQDKLRRRMSSNLIAELLKLPIGEVKAIAERPLSVTAFLKFPWLLERTKEPEYDFLHFTEGIYDEGYTRCPTCGHKILAPCIFCKTKELLATGAVPKNHYDDEEEWNPPKRLDFFK